LAARTAASVGSSPAAPLYALGLFGSGVIE